MSTKCGDRDPEIQVLLFDTEALICNLLTEEDPLLAGKCRFVSWCLLCVWMDPRRRRWRVNPQRRDPTLLFAVCGSASIFFGFMIKFCETRRMFISLEILKVYFSMLLLPHKRLKEPWVFCLPQAGLMLNRLSNTISTLKLQTVDRRREVSLVGQLYGPFVCRNCDLPTPRCSSCSNTSIVWLQSPGKEAVWGRYSN